MIRDVNFDRESIKMAAAKEIDQQSTLISKIDFQDWL